MGTYTPGKGSQLKMTISASLTKIDQVYSIKPSGPVMDEIKVVNLDSTAAERPCVGVPDWSPVEAKVHWNPANSTHQFLMTTALAGAPNVMQILFADAGAATQDFSGIILGHPFDEIDTTKVQDITITIGVNGAAPITP